MVFIIGVCYEFELTLFAVIRLVILYPNCKIVLCFDGTFSLCPKSIRQQLRERTYIINYDSGYRYATYNYLKFVINNFSFNYLVKIDPDTYVENYYDFNKLEQDVIHVNHNKQKSCVRGGIIIYPLIVARLVHESNLLLDKKYDHLPYRYFNTKLNKTVTSQDKIIYDVCTKLDIKIKSVNHFANITDKPILQNINSKYCFHHI